MLALFTVISLSKISVQTREDIIDAILDKIHDDSILKRFSHDPTFIRFLRSTIYDDSELFLPLINETSTDREVQHTWRYITNAIINFIAQEYRPSITIKQSGTNFAIPSWVIELIKYAIQKVIEYVASKYEITIQWDPAYKGQYQACVISLVTKSSKANGSIEDFFNYVKDTALRFISKIPIKFDFTTYEGNPSIIIYWNSN